MKKILIVEDDDKTRRSLWFVLKKAGYWVEEAADGKAALDKIFSDEESSDHFDLLLTDICMPGLNGIGLMKELVRKGFSIPTLVISAQVSDPVVREISTRKDLTFLAKPFGSEDLLTAVGGVLHGL